MAVAMIKNRQCPRCGGALFISEDPLDPPGSTYCLSGHSFYLRRKSAVAGLPAGALPTAAAGDRPAA